MILAFKKQSLRGGDVAKQRDSRLVGALQGNKLHRHDGFLGLLFQVFYQLGDKTLFFQDKTLK